MREKKPSFQQQYSDYLQWQQKRNELFPEMKPLEKKLKPNSWHFVGCPETGKIVIDRSPINPRDYIINNLPVPSEVQLCTECGGERTI